MKTLTTLTAIAALIAGISIASAASSMDKSDAMGSNHITGTAKFCISGAGGALNCKYASLADCKKAVTGSESCKARPVSTTGQGTKW